MIPEKASIIKTIDSFKFLKSDNEILFKYFS